MQKSDITIVIIHAAGYSGATWLNVILGSHESAMAMGPATRLFDLNGKDKKTACYIHRETCDLWPSFLAKDIEKGNFFLELAKQTNKHYFIVNYPKQAHYQQEISDQGYRVLHIKMVRDGRANLFSKLRHDRNNGRQEAIADVILSWQIPKWLQINRELPNNESLWQLVRYEDLLINPANTLEMLSQFLGLTYGLDSFKFWEFEHHLTAGNTAVIDSICKMQNLAGYNHHRESHYNAYLEKVQNNQEATFQDEEWKEGLSKADKVAFDCLFGPVNQALGYERDVFKERDIQTFWETFNFNASKGQANHSNQRKKNHKLLGINQLLQRWYR